MAGRPSERGLVAREYLERYGPEVPLARIARRMLEERSDLFSTYDQVRFLLKWHAGLRGNNSSGRCPNPVEGFPADQVKELPRMQPAKPTEQDKQQWKEQGDQATWSYDGSARITTLEQALQFSQVDLSVWEVDRHEFNTWTTTVTDKEKNPKLVWNVQVKVWFKRRADAGIDWARVFDELRSACKSASPVVRRGSGEVMALTADFHLGAYVNNLVRSDNFNIATLVDYLDGIAHILNKGRYERVHVAMLGDFIESFTGLNHANSWKGLSKGMYGMNATILCYEVLRDWLKRIRNLEAMYLVSGNHDRITSEKDGDAEGEVGAMLAYMLGETFGRERVRYNPSVLTAEVDDVAYVMTHGHLALSEKEISKVLFDYGIQDKYNVFAKGHRHTRQTVRSTKQRQLKYSDHEVVQLDDARYRAFTVPPLFTGNFYSESLGFTSSAGFILVENNGRGRINAYDYCL